MDVIILNDTIGSTTSEPLQEDTDNEGLTEQAIKNEEDLVFSLITREENAQPLIPCIYCDNGPLDRLHHSNIFLLHNLIAAHTVLVCCKKSRLTQRTIRKLGCAIAGKRHWHEAMERYGHGWYVNFSPLVINAARQLVENMGWLQWRFDWKAWLTLGLEQCGRVLEDAGHLALACLARAILTVACQDEEL